jgi:hypothetical protein
MKCWRSVSGFEGFFQVAKVHQQMANTDNDVVRQRGQNAPHDELHKEAIHDGRGLRKPSGEERLVPSNHSRIPTATKVITPETRWRMDAIAVIGNRIV